MRTSDCDLIFVPGTGDSGPEHWQTRWAQKLSSASRVVQEDWQRPVKKSWIAPIVAAVRASRRPAILVAHSLGVLAAAEAMRHLKDSKLKAAFLVAPPGKAYIISTSHIDHAFAEISHDPLPVPSMMIASRNDPHCPWLDAEELAYAWGSAFVDAGEAGHLNTDSGHGPWPEGLMRFAGFLSKI
jgi:predicted alpha/beta hydrolase family esterase